MKLFVGGVGSCSVHNEKYMIMTMAHIRNQLVDSYYDADVIVILDTCVGTYDSIIQSIEYVERVLEEKRDGSRVIVSGCLSRKLNVVFPDRYKHVLEKVEMVPQEDIVKYVYRLLELDLGGKREIDFNIPAYKLMTNSIRISPVSGCLNQCSFCKTRYADFPLRSIPIEGINHLVDGFSKLEELGRPIYSLRLSSCNLSLYGVDLYGESRAHELLKILSRPDSVKFISAGALINWNKNLLKEILDNPKIKYIFVALESGNERVYELMNRPIGLAELKRIILEIRRVRPDIIINTEFICGFPTETDEEFMQTIELICKLDIRPLHAYPYINSSCIPSARFEQCPDSVRLERGKMAIELLMPQINKYSRIIDNSELVVIGVDGIFSSYNVLCIDGSIRSIDMAYVGYGFKVGDLIPVNNSGIDRVFQRCRRNG